MPLRLVKAPCTPLHSSVANWDLPKERSSSCYRKMRATKSLSLSPHGSAPHGPSWMRGPIHWGACPVASPTVATSPESRKTSRVARSTCIVLSSRYPRYSPRNPIFYFLALVLTPNPTFTLSSRCDGAGARKQVCDNMGRAVSGEECSGGGGVRVLSRTAHVPRSLFRSPLHVYHP